MRDVASAETLPECLLADAPANVAGESSHGRIIAVLVCTRRSVVQLYVQPLV